MAKNLSIESLRAPKGGEAIWLLAARLLRFARNDMPVILSLLIPACHLQVPNPPDTLRENMGAEPDILNPILASDAYAARIDSYVNNPLIERDNDTLEFKPKLAKSWTISPDHLVYTFYLRDDVTWHDGKPFTADDVVFSFQKILDPKVEAPFLRVYFADVDRVEAKGPYVVRFIYKRPYFLGLSVCGSIPLVPKHLFENTDFNTNPANRHPIGVGPYKFVEWKTNKRIVLERNGDYWGDKPAIKRIEFQIIADDTVALQVLKKGDLDMAPLRPVQWVRQTQSEHFNKIFNKLKYLSPGFGYIGWNAKKPFFSDKRVRRAMTLLIDRKKILDKIYFGLGVVVESPFFIGSNQYDKKLIPLPYNPEEARKLLEEAGWKDTNHDGILDKDGKPFEFVFLYPASSHNTELIASILKEDFQKMGIIMNIEKMEWAAFIGKIEKKDFDATSLGWSTGFEDDPYQVWHSSQAKTDRGSNFISFENAEADRLMESARMEFNEKKRNALYARLQEIIRDEQPYTFLFTSFSLVAVDRRFQNVKVHKVGLDTTEWKL